MYNLPLKTSRKNVKKKLKSLCDIKIYSTADLVSVLNVHKRTIFRWKKEGLKPIFNSGFLLFDGKTVKKFLTIKKYKTEILEAFCLKCKKPNPFCLKNIKIIKKSDKVYFLQSNCIKCNTKIFKAQNKIGIAKVAKQIEKKTLNSITKCILDVIEV